MQSVPPNVVLALIGLGGSELILILAPVLILFGARKLPELARGLGDGLSRFRDALDDVAKDAGRTTGGIFGKRAAQAITPDNQIAELYDPRVFGPKRRRGKRHKGLLHYLARLWARISTLISRK